MTVYSYMHKTNCPMLREEDGENNLTGGLEYDIDQSTISSANLVCSSWFSNLAEIQITFDNDLSTADKSTLDTIMEDY